MTGGRTVDGWQRELRVDPIPALLSAGNEAVAYFARRDLLDEDPGPVSRLWRLPAALRILKKQQPNGSWPHPGRKEGQAVNCDLIGAWKQFRFLVQEYGFTVDDPATRRAAEFLFSCQTEAGDIRGFLANQYATYYTGAILSLLIQAGCEGDPRVEKGLQWLLSRAGLPLAAAAKVTLVLAAAVRSSGCAVTAGAVLTVSSAALLVAVPPVLVNTAR